MMERKSWMRKWFKMDEMFDDIIGFKKQILE